MDFKSLFGSFLNFAKENRRKLSGGGLILLGAYLVYSEGHVIVDLAIFLAGICFIYAGMKLLNFTLVTDFIDGLLIKFFKKS